jgi:hypothetical protein
VPDTEKALKIAAVIIVIFTIIMQAPNQKSFQRDFPGGPVVKTSHCHCRNIGSIPCGGTKISHPAQPKRKKGNHSRKGEVTQYTCVYVWVCVYMHICIHVSLSGTAKCYEDQICVKQCRVPAVAASTESSGKFNPEW